MPLLLALSGMLASRRIRDGWQRPAAALRAASSYYLYAVWLTVYFAFYLSVRGVDLPHRIGSFGGYLREFVAPETPLWYVFALALYMVVLTSIRRVPAPVVLVLLVALSVLTLVKDPGGHQYFKIPQNAVFFGVGVYCGPTLRRLAARRKVTDLLLWCAAGLIFVGIAKWSYGSVINAVLHDLRGFVFVMAGIVAVVNLIRWSPLGRLGEFIGRRTLQIYVLHAPLILVVVAILNDHRVRRIDSALHNPVVAVCWPIAVTLLIIAAALVIHRLLMFARLGFLFEMPDGVAQLIKSIYSRRTAVAPGADLARLGQASTSTP